jgi:hypothetical protein
MGFNSGLRSTTSHGAPPLNSSETSQKPSDSTTTLHAERLEYELRRYLTESGPDSTIEEAQWAQARLSEWQL